MSKFHSCANRDYWNWARKAEKSASDVAFIERIASDAAKR
jgi:hypothetical protein